MPAACRKLDSQSRQKPAHRPLLKLVAGTARTLGYGRVSTDDQNLDMQVTALRNAGVADKHLFLEKVSAVNAKRPQFHMLMKVLEPGDTLVVYAFSRLSRNLKQLLTLVDDLQEQGIALRSTSEPHIDPYTTNGRLLISVTGAVDENERNRVRDRTRDGMAVLKARGMWLGRKPKVSDADARKMLALRRAMSVEEIARRFKIKPSTVYARTNALKRAKQKK